MAGDVAADAMLVVLVVLAAAVRRGECAAGSDARAGEVEVEGEGEMETVAGGEGERWRRRAATRRSKSRRCCSSWCSRRCLSSLVLARVRISIATRCGGRWREQRCLSECDVWSGSGRAGRRETT